MGERGGMRFYCERRLGLGHEQECGFIDMIMTSAFILGVAAYILTAAAQLMLKKGAQHAGGKHLAMLWVNPWMLVGYGTMFAVTIMNLKAYQVLPLKVSVVLTPLTLVCVLLGSRWLFAEKLNRQAVLGVGMIIFGMLVFNWP